MKKSLESLKFIFSHVIRYFWTVAFVLVLIIFATWLQVKSPLIMGEAITTMTEYVVGENVSDMKTQLDSGKALTDKQINTLEKGEFIEKEQADQLKEMTDEQTASIWSYLTFEYKVINSDLDNLSNGYTDAQKEMIMTSNQPDEVKYMMLSATGETLKSKVDLYNNIEQFSRTNVDKKYDDFIRILIILVGSYLLLAASNAFYQFLMAGLSGNATRDMRRGLFGKLEKLSIRFFDQSNDGDILSRFTNDIDNITNAMGQSFIQITSQFALLIGILIMMFREDDSTMTLFKDTDREFILTNSLVWSMLFFALIAIVLAGFVIKKAKYYVSRQQDKLGQLNGYIDERISGQKIVITHGLEDETVDKFGEYNKEYRKFSLRGQIYSGMLMPLMNGIGLINLGVLVYFGSINYYNGVLEIGLLFAFIQYSQQFFGPLAQIVSQYNMVELAVSGGSRVKEVMDVESEITDSKGAMPIQGINGEVELKNVTFGYNKDAVVLNDINIKVKKGQMIALVGPTGSGKTTVMNLMNRFYDIDSGQILFDKKDIKDITLDTLRKNVGIVLQESVLFSGTIFDNISYGVDNASKEDVINAAKTANIHDFIMSLEDGYETNVDNNVSLFSTGQKQLMSIARTILTDPDLLILDEATSNVDTVTEARIQIAMQNVLKGRTSFVIAHRLKTILDADEIIVLKDGEIIEQGNHDKLYKEGGFYAELYKNQFVLD